MKALRIVTIVSILLAAVLGNQSARAQGGSQTATGSLDSRNYALTVSSAYGTPSPSAITHTNYCWHSSVSCSVEASVQEGGAIYNNIGWTGTGSVPASGSNHITPTFLLTTPASSITWLWQQEVTYALNVSHGSGDGSYVAGESVTITADAAPAGQEFAAWTGDVSCVGNTASATTVVIMPEQDVELTATYRALVAPDPFGAPAVYPTMPMSILASVTLFGIPAEDDDVLAVFCGDELRGKAKIMVFEGEAIANVSVYTAADGETLTFSIWDASENAVHVARFTVAATIVGGQLGSYPDGLFPVVVDDQVELEMVLQAGWSQMSLNLAVDDFSPAIVFADLLSEVKSVVGKVGSYNPELPPQLNTLSRLQLGEGYWVNMKTRQTLRLQGTPVDLASQPITLAAGWNHIGYLPLQGDSIRTVMGNALASGRIERITGIDGVFNPASTDVFNSMLSMHPGRGYWVKASAALTFTYQTPSSAMQAMVLSGTDPFGTVVQYPNPQMSVIARVRVNSQPVESGDVVAAYVGEELRAKASVVVSEGETFAVLAVQVKQNGEPLTFKLWDRSHDRVLEFPQDAVMTESGGEPYPYGHPLELNAFGRGTVTCVITPEDARDANAAWRVTTGPNTDWQESGALLTIPTGIYTIQFNEVNGWVSPDNQTTTVLPDVTVTNVASYTVRDMGAAALGVSFESSLPDVFNGAGKVTVTGLPPGLRYNATTRLITGVPTRVGTYKVTVTAPGIDPVTFEITVEALPAWAQGVFNGTVAGGGLATMTVSVVGKVTGKLAVGGTNYAFTALSYAAGGSAADGFTIASVAKAGKAALPLTLAVTQAASPASLAVAAGELALAGGRGVALWRDAWKGEAAALAPFIGYYTATLPGNDECGSGYLTFTVDKAGKVKVGGKLADGTAASASGTLILDEAGRVFAVVYASPAAYKGGRLFGLAEFVAPAAGEVYLRPLEEEPFVWQNRSPQATGVFGAGFLRETGLSGGWYSKTANLADYYAGKNLAAGVDTNAPAPELSAGSARYDAVWWDPTGIALTPTLKSGVMSGLAAPAAGKPVDPDKDGVWDYSPTNAAGLKVSLTRATGVFKGSFLAWFDYPVKKHVSKSLAFEGALTPVRENPDDGVEGRGYCLWPDKAVPPLPAKPYAFKWSYDFLLRAE